MSSYQGLTIKYRPKKFEDVVGQGHIIKTLINEIQNDKLANAYLFTGHHGTGKTTTARLLGRYLNCENRTGTEPCNECDSCKEIQFGNSIDVLEIDGASNRGIDEIRELRERVKYAPTKGKYKIYVIDEAHMLTEPAFNALLKTLEEPPSRVLFVLATTSPHKIPVTISSRCQRFNFRKVSTKEIETRIKNIAKTESIEIDDSAITVIAQKVDGAMRDAISLLEQLVSYSGGKITAEHIQQLLGMPNETIILKLTDYIIQKNPNGIIEILHNVLNEGLSPEELIESLVGHLHKLFLIKTKVETTDNPSYIAQVTSFQPTHILRLLEFLFDAQKELKFALSQEIYLEQILIRMAISTQIEIDKLLTMGQTEFSRIDNPVQSFINNPVDKKNPIEEIEVENKKATDSSDELANFQDKATTANSLWKALIEKVPISLSSFLSEGTPLKLEGNKLFVSYTNDFCRTQAESKKTNIEKILSDVGGEPMRISFESTKSEHPIGKRQNTMLEEPIVKSAIKILNAEAIGGR
ncbi:MAG: DNA polymerase III subunit gamma/tau [bacterium]|nr:DNA polymerase III subunit gamma/tau [bacterium]